MAKPMRDGGAGRPETEDAKRVAALRRIYETTMPKAWHDHVRRAFGAELVICNIPGEPIWYPPSEDGSLPGVLLARHPSDVLRRLMTIELYHQDQDGGAEVQP